MRDRPGPARRRSAFARLVVVAALAAGAAACGKGSQRRAPSNSASDVADRFVDYYFVEIDQDKALPLTTGDARRRIEEELEAVKQIRQDGYGPEKARPHVYYERVSLSTDGDGHRARAVYDITIQHGSDRSRRHALVSLHDQEGGQWRVAFFAVKDGPAPRRPGN